MMLDIYTTMMKDMLCCGVSCYVMLHYVMLCYVILCVSVCSAEEINTSVPSDQQLPVYLSSYLRDDYFIFITLTQ